MGSLTTSPRFTSNLPILYEIGWEMLMYPGPALSSVSGFRTWDTNLETYPSETNNSDFEVLTSGGTFTASSTAGPNGTGMFASTGAILRTKTNALAVTGSTNWSFAVVRAESWSSFRTACEMTAITGIGGRISSINGSWELNGEFSVDTAVAADTNWHLIEVKTIASGNDQMWIDGTLRAEANCYSQEITKFSVAGSHSGGYKWVGDWTLAGWYRGDLSAHPRYADLKSWVASTYGITVA